MKEILQRRLNEIILEPSQRSMSFLYHEGIVVLYLNGIEP